MQVNGHTHLLTHTHTIFGQYSGISSHSFGRSYFGGKVGAGRPIPWRTAAVAATIQQQPLLATSSSQLSNNVAENSSHPSMTLPPPSSRSRLRTPVLFPPDNQPFCRHPQVVVIQNDDQPLLVRAWEVQWVDRLGGGNLPAS